MISQRDQGVFRFMALLFVYSPSDYGENNQAIRTLISTPIINRWRIFANTAATRENNFDYSSDLCITPREFLVALVNATTILHGLCSHRDVRTRSFPRFVVRQPD